MLFDLSRFYFLLLLIFSLFSSSSLTGEGELAEMKVRSLHAELSKSNAVSG